MKYMNTNEAEEWVKTHRREFIQGLIKDAGVGVDAEPGAFFMAGLPGAGKTEISRGIIADFGVPMLRIDMDEIAEKIPGYEPKMADRFRKSATILLSEILNYAIHHNIDFLMDGTFGGSKATENITRCLNHGYSVQIIYVFQKPKLAWEFTRAREKVEHRAIRFDGFVDAYYKTINNIKRVGREYSHQISIDIVIKNEDNQVGEWLRNVDISKIDEILNIEYNRDKLIKETLG